MLKIIAQTKSRLFFLFVELVVKKLQKFDNCSRTEFPFVWKKNRSYLILSYLEIRTSKRLWKFGVLLYQRSLPHSKVAKLYLYKIHNVNIGTSVDGNSYVKEGMVHVKVGTYVVKSIYMSMFKDVRFMSIVTAF